MSALHLYGIANCDTVKRARAWLNEQGAAHEFHDFKKLGVPLASLDRWVESAGWSTLLNRRGTTWRKLDEVAKAAAQSEAGARALMLVQPSLVKRPVVEWPSGEVSAGFSPEGFAERLGRSGGQ